MPWRNTWAYCSLALLLLTSPVLLAQPAPAPVPPPLTTAPLPSPSPPDPLLTPVKLEQGETVPYAGFLFRRPALELIVAQSTALTRCQLDLATERARLPVVVERVVEHVPSCPPCPLPPPPPSPWPDRWLGAGMDALVTGALLFGLAMATR